MFSLPEQPVGIGKILDSGIKLFSASFKKVFPLAVVISLVSTVLAIYYLNNMPQMGESSSPEQMATFRAALPMIGMAWSIMVIVGILLMGAIVYRIGNTAMGRTDTMGEALGVGFKKFIPLLFAILLYTLAMMFGMLLLIIPGVYLMLSLSFYLYYLVNEDAGIFASLKQSYRLIKGNWWRTATVYMAPLLIMIAVIGGISLVTHTMLRDFSKDTVQIVSGVVNSVLYPLIYSIGYVQFNDLKLRKSRSDLEARM